MDLTFKHFLRTTTLLIFSLILFSCSVKKNDENLIWYENQVIEQAVPEQDSVYRIQIGMMASSFWLDNKGDERKDQLSLLQESLKQRNLLTIGVEKGTNKIIRVTK
ncbi:hypothetical protein OHD16_20655 [Sphingobacterium sp. ML3W]|uniref:hypothetical protein n=1 Tax=Sphingobacterium sp. ML3W TaxID=1538644 RepID=UPI002499BD38|nr:hypothetical protein [Sphingobacterium sp. ML3W]WFA82373.1 hypothetical protein OGI71_13795 [Sphingobacterium sp. ML3W]